MSDSERTPVDELIGEWVHVSGDPNEWILAETDVSDEVVAELLEDGVSMDIEIFGNDSGPRDLLWTSIDRQDRYKLVSPSGWSERTYLTR